MTRGELMVAGFLNIALQIAVWLVLVIFTINLIASICMMRYESVAILKHTYESGKLTLDIMTPSSFHHLVFTRYTVENDVIYLKVIATPIKSIFIWGSGRKQITIPVNEGREYTVMLYDGENYCTKEVVTTA